MAAFHWALLLCLSVFLSEGRLRGSSQSSCVAQDSKVVIVGGGPPGIHMASQLKKRGYTDVVVLEKEDEEMRFGKTHSLKLSETGDLPHELGTCYLSASYSKIRELLREYVGPDATIIPGGGDAGSYGTLMLPSPSVVPGIALKDTEWWVANVNRNGGHGMQDMSFYVQKMVEEATKYVALHKSIFGESDPHGLPPQPSEEGMRHLNQTYNDFMVSNGMPNLLDYTTTGMGSYGFAYDVPALYGLMFVNPMVVMNTLQKTMPSVALVKKGYSELWKQMVLKHELDLRRGHSVQKIEHMSGPHNFKLQVRSKGEMKLMFADELILATPVSEKMTREILAEPSSLELTMASSMKNVGLNVIMYKTEKRTLAGTQGPMSDQALVFYPESLQRAFTHVPAGEVYAERNNVLAYQWERDGDLADRYDMVYQFYSNPEQDGAAARANASAFITSKERTGSPVPGSPRFMTERYYQDYFPHFTIEATMKRLPWKVFEDQEKKHMWHIGDSVVFESAEDVVSYNDQVLENTKLQNQFCSQTIV